MANLKALTVEVVPGEDGPYAAQDLGTFVPETTDYAVTVPHGTTHARLKPTALRGKQRLEVGAGPQFQPERKGARG